MSPLIVGSNSEGSEGRSDRLGLPVGTSDPGTAEAGDLYYKTDTNKIRYYDGTQWNDLAAGSGGNGGNNGGNNGGGNSNFQITRSLLFQPTTTTVSGSTVATHLARTFGGGNRKKFTFSCWVKQSAAVENNIFVAGSGTSNSIRFNANGTVQIKACGGSVSSDDPDSAQPMFTSVFRDYSGWMHLCVAVNSQLQAPSERIRCWINGKRVVLHGTTATSDGEGNFNDSGTEHRIGCQTHNNSNQLDGYLAEVHWIDGLALGPSSFAETNTTTGVWNPREFEGTSINDGTTWSNSSSDPNTIKQGGAASALFAGNLTTGGITLTQSNTDYYQALTGVSITCHKSVSFWSANGASTATMRINGNDALKVEAQSTTNQWWTLDFTGTITKIELGYLGGSGSSNTYYALAVDGQILLDTTNEAHVYGSNGFHLDFANGAVDSSSNSNDFTAVGINPYSYSGQVQYGEASPFDNAFDTSGSVTKDTTGYSYSNVSSPKTDTGDANNATVLKTSNGDAIYWEFTDDNENTNRYLHTSSDGINWSGALYQTSDGPVIIGPAAWVAWAGGSNSDVTTVTWDSPEVVVDSPTNGTASTGGDPGGEVLGCYATMNPIDQQFTDNGGFSEGNLKYVQSSTGARGCRATMGVSSGKWYWEFEHLGGNASHGIQKASSDLGSYPGGSDADGISWFVGGNIYRDGSTSAYSSKTYSVGDCIGTALDLDNGTVTFYKNGATQGVAAEGLTGEWFPAFGSSNVSNVSVRANFGQKKFKYPAPAGFKSLCTTNLPTPDISKGSSYVDAKPYFGTGATNPQILGFTPDLVLLKRRTGGNAKAMFFDQLRGASNAMYITDPDGNTTNQQLASFTADNGSLTVNGFSPTGTSGFINADGADYAAWAWDAGETNNSVSAGGLNNTAYNQDYTWSDSLTSSTGFRGPEPATNAFDGNTGTVASAPDSQGSGGTITFTSPVAVPADSTIRVWVNGGDHNCTVNGGATQSITAGLWVDLEYTNRTNSTFVLTFQRDASADTGIRAIQIGGRILVNTNVTPSTNIPTLATSYRATPSAGCSVVSYSGVDTPSVNTVAHGLNKSPELYIIKKYTSTSAQGWIVNTTVIDGSVDYALLNSNVAKADQGSPWNTLPTPYAITLGANDSNTCDAGESYVAYCFHSVDGFSRIGSFNNNNGQGAFVYCGFKPRIILLKNMLDLGGQTGVGDWMIYDTARNPFNNPDNMNTLAIQEVNQEDDFYAPTQAGLDILSNGFKIRHYNSSPAGDPNRQIWFAAWAENPFALNSRAS